MTSSRKEGGMLLKKYFYGWKTTFTIFIRAGAGAGEKNPDPEPVKNRPASQHCGSWPCSTDLFKPVNF